MKKTILVCLALALMLVAILNSGYKVNQTKTTNLTLPAEEKQLLPTESPEAVYPIAEFKQRITKKPFGIYVTPQNSPVQPERFIGYHTGVDVEYEDVEKDVAVFAVCDGKIEQAKWVSGYGGLMVLRCNLNNQGLYFIYGHLDAASFTKNVNVKKGEQLAILGIGDTQQTDFERKHLHFGIRKNTPDIRGYVQSKGELNSWHDPQQFFN